MTLNPTDNPFAAPTAPLGPGDAERPGWRLVPAAATFALGLVLWTAAVVGSRETWSTAVRLRDAARSVAVFRGAALVVACLGPGTLLLAASVLWLGFRRKRALQCSMISLGLLLAFALLVSLV